MKLHRLLTAALLLLGCVCAAAANPVYTLLVPETAVAAGTTLEVSVAVLNTGPEPVTVEWPQEVPAELVGQGRRIAVTLRLVDAPAAQQRVGVGGFALQRAVVQLPPEVPLGPAVLAARLAGGDRVRAAIEVAGEVRPGAQPAATQRPPTSLVRSQPAAAVLRRTFADRIGAHEPVYFIAGPEAPAAKFQLSFKYKILDFADVAPQRMLRTLQFGYTQRSLWDIGGVSSPFYDTSYMPELMYEALAPQAERGGGMTWLGVQAAFKHESNGRDGALSRSLNLVYARPVFAFGALDGWHALLMPEVFAYVGDLSDNRDLREYRGYGQLRFVVGRNDGPSLMTTFRAGRKFNRATLQFDFTMPLRTQLLHFETYFLLQYFSGYGESLLSYRERSETVRAGFSVVR